MWCDIWVVGIRDRYITSQKNFFLLSFSASRFIRLFHCLGMWSWFQNLGRLMSLSTCTMYTVVRPFFHLSIHWLHFDLFVPHMFGGRSPIPQFVGWLLQICVHACVRVCVLFQIVTGMGNGFQHIEVSYELSLVCRYYGTKASVHRPELSRTPVSHEDGMKKMILTLQSWPASTAFPRRMLQNHVLRKETGS